MIVGAPGDYGPEVAHHRGRDEFKNLRLGGGMPQDFENDGGRVPIGNLMGGKSKIGHTYHFLLFYAFLMPNFSAAPSAPHILASIS